MAQHAAQDGGTRSQSLPFGYDAAWLAQQQGQMQFGFSTDFSFSQHHQQSNTSAGGSILDHTDNSLLGDFFSNPDITAQMSFNFSAAAEGGDGGDSKTNSGIGLFDLDHQGGTINDPGTAFAPQHHTYGSDYQTQHHPNDHSQPQSMSNQMSHGRNSHVQDDEVGEEEETKAMVAEGLMGMSASTNIDRPKPPQMILGGMGGFRNAQAWGGIGVNAPPAHMRNIQHPLVSGSELHGQASDGPFGYSVSNTPSHYLSEHGFPMNAHMQQQAYNLQARGRPHSMSDIRTAGLAHLPQAEPRSAQLPTPNFPSFTDFNHFDNIPRPGLNVPRWGSDEGFGSNGYRPPNNYTPPDEKAANLNHVPLADEAGATRRSRQPPMVPPHARTFQAGAHTQRSQGYNSPISQPSTPTFYNNTNSNHTYLAGLPTTQGGATMAGTPMSYGGFGITPFHGHGHPQPRYWQNMHASRPGMDDRQIREVDDEVENHSSSGNEDGSEAESPPPSSQPARKRRRSNYEREGEAEYQPPGGNPRRVNSTLDGSSDEDEYAPDASSGKKRARPLLAHRASFTNSSSTTSPPLVGTPRPTSAASGSDKKSTRKRHSSGNQISRPPLTDEQRRQNHIKSEKNRRDLIKVNYTELNNLIPALKGGKSGLSKSEVLKEIVEFIEELEAGNEHMESVLEAWGDRVKGEYDDGFSSSSSDEGPGGAAGGLNGIQAY